MPITVSSPETSNQDLENFYALLGKIQDHPFVTDASKAKRAEAEEIALQIVDFRDTAGIGILPHAVFMYGSVGAGVAEPNSDLDGFVFYKIPEQFNISKWQYIKDTVLSRHSRISRNIDHRDFRLQEFDEVLFRAFHRDNIFNYLSLLETQKICLAANSLAVAGNIFLPSLNEFRNPKERDLIFEWRKAFLRNLSKLPYSDQEKIWSNLCERLRGKAVLYENPDLQRDKDKRNARVKRAFESTYQARYGETHEKRDRVASIIDRRRANLRYPSLESMYRAFEII